MQIEKPKQPEISVTLQEAEGYLKKGQFPECKQLLLTLDSNDDFVRKYLSELIIETEDYDLAIESFKEPRTESELITILNASIRLNKKNILRETIGIAKNFGSESNAIKDLIKKAEALLKWANKANYHFK